jgi:hypothetical protein
MAMRPAGSGSNGSSDMSGGSTNAGGNAEGWPKSSTEAARSHQLLDLLGRSQQLNAHETLPTAI